MRGMGSSWLEGRDVWRDTVVLHRRRRSSPAVDVVQRLRREIFGLQPLPEIRSQRGMGVSTEFVVHVVLEGTTYGH